MMKELFKFPIVMVDYDNEERKSAEDRLLGKIGDEESSPELDMIFGEAEYPYWDFIGIEDRWLPRKQSVDSAINGKFDACTVRFANVGQLLVPWTKNKFKKEITKFSEEYELTKSDDKKEIKIVNLTAEQYQEILNKVK